ncbi:hypothetical protein GGI22_002657 [Coemansia erecta]|nr:hypothetical protein GGI22_002657 [Coemansia erecta]
MVQYPVLQYTLSFKASEQDNSGQVSKINLLKDSFNRLTQLYPIVLGHKERVDNKNIITISEEDLSKHRFFVHHEPDITADEFAKIRCCRDLWPAKVDRLLRERTADTECLIAVVVVCFKDGYILSLSTSHIVADVSGLFILLEQWASIARKIAAHARDTPLDVSQIMPEREIDFDHTRFWQRLAAHPKDEHPHITYVRQQDIGDITQISKLVHDYYSTGARGGDRTALGLRVLHVSGKNIAKLGAKFNTDKHLLHGVQLFYAVFWQRYVANSLLLRGAETDHSQTVFLNIIHNVRGIAPAPDYVGNAVGPVFVRTTIGELLTKPVIETAHLIKLHINTITPGATVQCAETMNDPNSTFIPKLMYLQRHPESNLTLSNASRLPFFDLDFGLGKVTGVHCGKVAVEGMTSWVPHADGGVELYFGAKDDIYNMLKNDSEFSEYVDFEN